MTKTYRYGRGMEHKQDHPNAYDMDVLNQCKFPMQGWTTLLPGYVRQDDTWDFYPAFRLYD